ncbi:MAG TPA: molybdopterin-binding protein [Casimicrobiaceae bacterium]|nr:molybdopterin-binding protein [Casimicrobiaceae bacterium]
MKPDTSRRRRFLQRTLLAAGAPVLSACQRVSETEWFGRVIAASESLSRSVSTTIGRHAMAQEFTPADLSPTFRSNGTAEPDTDAYRALMKGEFVSYALEVGGLVTAPRKFTLAELRALPSRTQITRHDCVEGWSAIGKWKGARLSALLDAVGTSPDARYIVFHCADPMEDDGTGFYYESIDVDDARHEQTILAYELNDAPLPVKNGAPLRLRVERQLGYKHAKYLMRIELVQSFASIRGGKGGYWEDQGYQWFAGI